MKVLFTIVVCKVLRWIGKMVGKGSSLPGKIALRICPDILDRVKLPKYIIAVTGSNGKTSTVEMIAHILMKNGKNVAWNTKEPAAPLIEIIKGSAILRNTQSFAVILKKDERKS